jgi:hypothetical protein
MDWIPEELRVRRIDGSTANGGTLTTRPIQFAGAHLFVNADLDRGELRVEVLDRSGQALPAFTREGCAPLTGSGTKMPVKWTSGSLADVAGKPVRLRFSMTHGRLYSFWVSAHSTGESGGYPAAGGPQFGGPVDVPASGRTATGKGMP